MSSVRQSLVGGAGLYRQSKEGASIDGVYLKTSSSREENKYISDFYFFLLIFELPP